METNLKFYWNGIKASGGKLQGCFYSLGNLINYPGDTLTIYARNSRFSIEVRASFVVQNDSDSQSDYFVHDKIRVAATHPLYAEVLAARNASEARNLRRLAKRASQMLA